MISINKDNAAICSGCAACAEICPESCINMKADKMGFLYPEVEASRCIDCGLCSRICPSSVKEKSDGNGFLGLYAAQSSDDSLRLSSSSGGLFNLFARYILSQNGVVFGAAFDETFHGVVHTEVQSVHNLYKLQGSKYIQSSIGNSYHSAKTYLEQGRTVLFSGTPCQIKGLKAFLHKDYENLYLLDIVCHGVPAPGVWDEYVSFLENKYKGNITGVSFRDKRHGWHNYVLSVKFDNGKEYVNNRSDDLYMRGFLHDCYLRPSCFECKHKGLERFSDITIGDLWGAESIAPELDDNKGTSLVMIFSDKGRRLFESVSADVKSKTVTAEEVVKYNPAIIKSPDFNPQSISFEKEFGNKNIGNLLNKFCSVPVYRKILRKAKNIIRG